MQVNDQFAQMFLTSTYQLGKINVKGNYLPADTPLSDPNVFNIVPVPGPKRLYRDAADPLAIDPLNPDRPLSESPLQMVAPVSDTATALPPSVAHPTAAAIAPTPTNTGAHSYSSSNGISLLTPANVAPPLQTFVQPVESLGGIPLWMVLAGGLALAFALRRNF